ncbi:MAG: hypothetical protein K6G10_06720 [Butyrivibrio sp.]|nr:hypothetical protein [Butyrivibrio sp.]
MNRESVIYEYEQILLGKRKGFTASFHDSPEENRIAVGWVWRYAIEKILGWTPEAALKNVNAEVIDALKLKPTLNVNGIDYKEGKTYIADYRFILQYAFPDEIKYDFVDETISEYERISKLGVWRSDKTPDRYTKRFYRDDKGIMRAKILMRYVVDHYLSDMTLREKYEFFTDAPRATKWLDEKSLGTPLRDIYTSPLVYFHESLPLSERSNILYSTCKLREETMPDSEKEL